MGIYEANSTFPILSLITYLPLIGAIILLVFPKESTGAIKFMATFMSAVTFLVSIPLWFAFDRGAAAPLFQFQERAPWIPTLGVEYNFAIDGIALLLILLTNMMSLIAIYSSYTAIEHREKEYYILLLFLQTGMLGVFCALDFFLFYVFWEVMLVPMYFLIGVWGGSRK